MFEKRRNATILTPEHSFVGIRYTWFRERIQRIPWLEKVAADGEWHALQSGHPLGIGREVFMRQTHCVAILRV